MKTKEEVMKEEYEATRERIEAIKESNRCNGDNVNKYAVKFQLGKRKVHRANVNAQ